MRRRSGQRRTAMRTGGYRPAHAWLGRPGDGVPLRQRRSSGWRWRFRWLQLRVLGLAAVVAAIAWWQVWASAP
ncbi:MAG: hypothetical protein V4574_04655 [Pseudomonadota bacterium]